MYTCFVVKLSRVGYVIYQEVVKPQSDFCTVIIVTSSYSYLYHFFVSLVSKVRQLYVYIMRKIVNMLTSVMYRYLPSKGGPNGKSTLYSQATPE